MRLAGKLAAALIAVTALIFGVRGLQNAQRQMAAAERDIRDTQWLIGRALRPALVHIWSTEGRQRALETVSYANERVRRARPDVDMEIRCVSLDLSEPGAIMPRVGALDRASLHENEDALDFIRVEGKIERLITYLPVIVKDRAVAALELSESLVRHRAQVREELWGIAFRTLLSAVLSAGAIGLLGFLMVGRPMRRLVAKARRMGQGDLSGPLDIASRDEIGEVAIELNETCNRLEAAQERVEHETKARIVAHEQLRHADRLTTVGTLASGIAHELGTPLNVVSGRARMIAAGELDPAEIPDSARIIADQAERMAKIIRQLLDFARRRAPERSRQSIAQVVASTIALLEPMARKRQVSIVAPPRDQPPLHVLIDGVQVQQAVANLVVNGIQSMASGGRLEIRVGRDMSKPPTDLTGPPRAYASVEVIDQGAGIAPEQLGRVFEPFFTTKDVGEGTGLGLSVAYGIVRDHGGWISVESQVGRGSRFTVHLPLGSDHTETR